MLKSNSTRFFNRLKDYFNQQYKNDNETKYYTDAEKALYFKNAVVSYQKQFTPGAILEYINAGGRFFYDAENAVKLLASFYAETDDEKRQYFDKWIKAYYKSDGENYLYIFNHLAEKLYKYVEKATKNLQALPEIELYYMYMCNTKQDNAGREYGYFIYKDSLFVREFLIDNLPGAPNIREYCQHDVVVVFKNGELYKIEKEV